MSRPKNTNRNMYFTLNKTSMGICILLYAVFFLSQTFPFHALSDHNKHLWSFYHTAEYFSLDSWTSQLNAPSGGILWDVMFLPSLLLSPITNFFSPDISLLCFISISLTLSIRFHFQLFHKFTSILSASICSLLATFTPYLFGYPLSSGVYERLSIWFFPLLILLHLNFKKQQSNQKYHALLMAFSVFFVAASCSVYALYGIFLLTILEIHLCFKTSFTSWKERFPLWISVLFPALLVLSYVSYISNSEWSLAPQPSRFSFDILAYYESASLKNLLFFWHANTIEPVDSGDWLLRLYFIGMIPIGCTIYNLWKYKNDDSSNQKILFFLPILGILWISLSLGPLQNPIAAIFSYVLPFYGGIMDAFQQVAVGIPLIYLSVAIALDHAKKYAPLILIPLCFEQWFSIPDIQYLKGISHDTIYEKIQNGGVIDIPKQIKERQIASSIAFWGQIQHKQPIPYSIFHGVTEWDFYEPIIRGTSSDWNATLKCFAKAGFRWIVIHHHDQKNSNQSLNTVRQIHSPYAKFPFFSDRNHSIIDIKDLMPNVEIESAKKIPPANHNTSSQNNEARNPKDIDIFSDITTKCPLQ